MADRLVWYVGDLAPPIEQTITSDGEPVNISSASAKKFKMRLVGSSTLKVNADAAFITDGSDGGLRYVWTGTDTDTAGDYLCWWEVTISSKVQAVGETVIEVRAHAPVTANYVELEQLKSSLQLTGTSFADGDVADAIGAACRKIDQACNRRFWLDTDAAQVRYYTPVRAGHLLIDDLVTLTTFKVDSNGDGTFEDTWTSGTQFNLHPLNAAADGWPYTSVEVRWRSGAYLPCDLRSVQVTGRFGWSAVPEPITEAATILSARLLKRAREAPFMVAAVGADGIGVRVATLDADVEQLIAPYRRLLF